MPELVAKIGKVAEFLGTNESAVTELIREGRLDRVLLATLSRRGAVVTPGLKNSVRTLVRKMEPEATSLADAATPLQPLESESTATIMFTDIVGSTDMMGRLGDREGRRVFSLHDRVIRQQAATHQGLEVKSTGDGFMLAFRSARRGVACAVGVQRAMLEYNALNGRDPILVRIGLSVGEPINESEDLFGMAVNEAARIMSVAQGGQILVSQLIHALASSSMDFVFRSLGEIALNGIDGPHRLYEVLWNDR